MEFSAGERGRPDVVPPSSLSAAIRWLMAPSYAAMSQIAIHWLPLPADLLEFAFSTTDVHPCNNRDWSDSTMKGRIPISTNHPTSAGVLTNTPHDILERLAASTTLRTAFSIRGSSMQYTP